MRDSANDAFFTAESLENLSEALIREGIQNSLDAAVRGPGNVREVTVKISLVPKASGDALKRILALFDPVRNHFERGLSTGLLTRLTESNTGWLVFEDFGTKGLDGDISEWRLDQSESNAFFSFFRAEGRSSKSGASLGRWGIGKQVFPTASQLHAMFGLSVRSDSPNKVLMGSGVIRTHSIDGKDYQPDAWFGYRENNDAQVMPVSEASFIEDFCQIFGLKRKDELGFSVVVPFMDERLNVDDLRKGIIRNFFWPILLGELVVELAESGGNWRLDAETITPHRSLLPLPEAALVEFASWASVTKPNQIVNLPESAAGRPDWRATGEALLPEAKLEEIRAHLLAEQKVGIKIPVLVRPKGRDGNERMSYFHIFIEVCRDGGYPPQFLRDGILIKDVKSPKLQGCRALVSVDDPPLAGLLGDSEGVNHTQWQKDSPKFHNRYVYGPDTIKFVTRSVFEVMTALHKEDSKGDPTLLLDIFFLPLDSGKAEPSKRPKPAKDGTVIPPVSGGPESKPKLFEIRQVKGGFVIKPGKTPATNPVFIKIEAGYAIRRGNAIKRWAADDFAFTRLPLRYEPKPNGVIVTREYGNCIELEIRKPEFEFGIEGFDKNRDLVVRGTKLRGKDEEDV